MIEVPILYIEVLILIIFYIEVPLLNIKALGICIEPLIFYIEAFVLY
jgi:hypothetical protein